MNDKDITILLKCDLFKNFSNEDIIHITKCFNTTVEEYSPKSVILNLHEQVNCVYIILDGIIEASKENFNGDRHLLMVLGTSDIFGEGIVCTEKRLSPVTITAQTKVRIMTIPYQKIIHVCTNSCSFHTKLIYNMMLLLGEKNYSLNSKVNLLLLHGIREKTVHFLLEQSAEQNSLKFTIPLTHTQLADYLNVSRPSMSRELGKLKKDEYIDYYKSTFYIKDYDALCNMI